MTEEEKRKKLESIYKDDDLVDKDGISQRQYAEYVDTTGGMHYKPAPTPSTTTHRDYATYSRAKAYMDLSDTEKADKRLYNQWQAYQKALDARKNAQFMSSDKGKATKLARDLKQELKKAYAERYGSDAGFGKWLASGVQTGLMGFANSAYQTLGMVEDAVTNAANNAYWTLNNGNNPDRWMKSYFGDNPNEDDPMYKVYTAYKNAQAARKGAGAFSGVSGDTWMSAEKQLRDRLEQMYRERINDDNLFDPNGGLFHEVAEYSNELYNWNQEQNQLQTEFQKTRSGNDKAWDIANQLVIGTAQAVPYAAFGMLGAAGAAGGEIGAQLSPQTTGILNKVAETLQSFAKSPDYWLAFTQETGNTYREALDAGASQDTAALTATLVGLINGAIEIGLPGGNGGIQDLPERLIKNGKGSRKAIQEWVESSVSEGKEEILQGVISNLAEKLGYNKAKAWTGNEGVFDVNALAKEGFMGMAVGGILGGGQAVGVNAYNRSVQNRLNEQYAATGARFRNKADTIIENALNLPETTEAYKLAQELKSRQSEDLDEEQKSKLYSNEEIGRLYSQTMRDTGIDYNPRADALEAIENRLKHLGETSDTRETAQLVLEAAERGVLSSVDKSTKLKNSKYGQRVLNEFRDSELIPQYDSEWADKLRLRTAEKVATPELTQAERGARIERLERKVNDNVNPAEKADIDTLAEKYGAQANVFKEAAKAVEGTDIYYFDDAYHTVYQLAKNGLDESTIRKDPKTSWLSPAAFKVAYNAGQNAQTFKSGTRYNPNATLKLNGINYKSLNNKQRASVRALMEIARVTGINIELFDSTMADGTLGNEQGSYVNGKIRIDINAGMLDKSDILNVAMLRTASHELTHYIQQNNKDAYQELKDFVFDKLQVAMFSDGKYKDAETWIRSKMEQLKMEDTDKNYSIASDEVVADACEMMLKDSTAFETLAKENPSLARRLLDWLKGLIADIKKAFSGVEAASTEAKAMIGSMEELQKKWDAALVGAVQNTKEYNGDGVAMTNEQAFLDSEEAVQNQIRPPYTDKTNAFNEFADSLNPEARATFDLFYGFYQRSRLTNTTNVQGKPVKGINISAPYLTVQQWNDKLKSDKKWAECARGLAEFLPENVRTAMRMNEDGTLKPSPLEDRFKMQISLAQRLVDALPLEKIDINYKLGDKTIKLSDGKAVQSVGGEAYRRAVIDETRKLYNEGKLKKVSIGAMSKDRWGSLGFLASNGKTGASGDLTTLCPQMMFNEGCFYCYRRAAMESGVNNKLVAQRVWYTGEILRIKDGDVKALNENGGLRIQSFGDWMPQFSAQLADILYDAELRGLQVKIITKEPSMIEYIARLKNQGVGKSLYFNLSADYVIEKGPAAPVNQGAESLAQVNWERPFMRDEDGTFWWKRAMTVEEAQKFREKYPWVNTRIVATRIEEFIRGLRDPHVDVVTGYHGHIRNWERIDASTGERLVGKKAIVEPVGDAGMPRFSFNPETKAWEIEYAGKTKVHQALAQAIEDNGLQMEYYTKTCCITGRCATCNGKCGALARSFSVKNATNRDVESVAYWQDHMTKAEMDLDEDIDDVQNSLRVTPEQDKRYLELAKDPQKNEAELAKFVRDAARKAEFDTPLLFHGTRWFGWTIYKDSEHDTPFVYTSTNRTVSAHYAGDQHYAFVRPIGRKYRTGNSVSDIIQNAETVYGAKYHLMSADERQAVYNEEVSKAKKIADEIDAAYVYFDNIPDEVNNAMSWIVDPFFTVRDNDSFNVFPDNKPTALSENIEDKRQELSDSLRHFEESARVLKEWYSEHRAELSAEQKKYISYLLGYDVGDAAIDLQYRLSRVLEDDVIVNETGGMNIPAELKESMDEIHEIAAYQLYGNLGDKPFTVDANGAQFWGIKVPEMGDGYYSTDSIAKWALEHGYTSVIMKNIYDYGDKADNYVFFSSNQIKSADPVTYDDSGEVIPLSERFNTENEDIRYQLREQGLSAREILSTALTDVAETEAERDKLKSYQRAVKTLDETQARLDEVRQEIHSIMFTAGSDRSNLKALETEKANLEKKLDWWDKRLMSLQNTAPLRAVLERERARVRKRTREEIMENVRDKRETSAVRKSIKNLMEKWNSKLQSDTPARNIPAPFKQAIAELSQAMDLTSGRPLSEKAVDKLNKLKSVYDLVMNDDDFKVYQNPIVKMYVDNAVSIINNTPLRQMGREQLEALYDAMKCINSTMFEANRLRDKAYRRDLAETGRAMITDTTEAIAPKWKFWRDYETWQLTPRRFFAMLGGWKKGSAWEQVADSFQEGTRRALRVERDFYNMFRQFTEAPEIDRLTNPNKLIDIGLVGRDGKPVKITRGMMLSIYMHLLSEDNRRALLYGGLNVPVLAEYYGQKIAESYTTGHENVVGILEDMTKLSEQIYQLSTDKSLTDEEKQQKIEEIGKKQDQLEAEGYDRLDALKNRIYNEMTDFEKKLTETATAWNDGKSQNYINEVTMEQYQIKRAKVKNYWRIHRDTSFVQTDFESVAKNMNLANVGWLKDRVKSAAPVLLTDFVYEMDNNVKSLATFYGYAIAQADFNKLYNYKIPGVNKSVQDEVKQKYGGGKKSFGVTADQYVENFIGDVVGSRLKPDTSIWAAVRRNLPRATLTLNPRVALSQIASVPTAAAEVGWGNMAKGFFRGLPTAFNKNAKEELMQKDEYFFQRYRGDGSMREFADMKSGNNIIDKLWNKADKLTKHALLNWCQNFDVFATATMWSMAEEWVKSNTNLTGEAFEAAVKQKYDDIITNTQPNYTKTERSDLLRDTREAYKFLTMYKTQSNQNFNILKEANARLRKTASDYKNGKNGVTKADLNEARKRFANAYSAVLLGGTLAFVALRALANALLGHMNDYRDDDDEITKASVLNGITVASLQSMANMFVLGSEVEALVEKSITGKKYYGLEDTALASANNVLKQFQALAVAYATGETDDIGPKWAKLTQNAAQIVGLPYSSVKTFIEAGKTWAKDIERGTFGSYEGAVERSNKVNYNRLYKALEDGNTAKADSIREEIHRNSPDIEDKTIDSGLRNVIKGMWEDGVISSSEAVDKLVEYTGKDKDTAYWDVQKWSNKANAEEDEKYTDSNYYRLWQVIDNDGDADAAMSELLEHGKDANQVATDIRGHIKDEFVAGTLTEKEAADKLYRYGTHKDNGKQVKYTVQEANEIVAEWSAKQKLGWDYDDKENLYKNGEISKSELKQAMISIGGYTSEKADEKITVYDWQNEGYDDITYASIKEYNGGPKSAGVSHAIWYKYWLAEKSTQADYKANGDTIPYSKMIKVFQYIGNLNITNDQKYALAKTYTDSDANIAKYKTW